MIKTKRSLNDYSISVKQVEKHLEEDFHVSWYIIFYKFSLGFIELLLGLGIILFGQQTMRWYKVAASHELSEDPHDLLVHISANVVPNILTHNTYFIAYLMLLGSAKIAGSIGLLYKKNWGVDVLVGLTILLFPFQLVNVLIHPNIFDCIYIALGIFIALYLIEFKPRAWISKLLLQWNSIKN